MNPYSEATFLEWFGIFLSRLLQGTFFAPGEVLFSDDIQGIVFSLFACNAAILGSLLLLKRLTMMANAISHTMVLGIVIAFYLYKLGLLGVHEEGASAHAHPPEALLSFFAVLVALITSGLTQFFSRFRLVREDAANAMVFSFLFALGITLVSTLAKNAHAGVELLMGNPDALHEADIPPTAYVFLFCAGIVLLSFRGMKVSLFDPIYGRVGGMRPALMIAILLSLVSVTLVASFRAVGFIMSLAFFVIPPLMTRLFVRSLKKMIFFSAGLGVTLSLAAVALSRHLLTVYDLAVSTGALAVSLLGVIYIAAVLLSLGFWKATEKKRHSTGPSMQHASSGGGWD